MPKWLLLPLVALPFVAAAASGAAPRDRDHDGLSDRREHRLGTNPRKKDTDGDGYSDRAEVRAGTNPRKRTSHPRRTRFPRASTTGVPRGTKLKPSGGLTIRRAGTVVDGRAITGQVVVNAPNVTIRNSRIRSNAMWVVENNSRGLVISHSEIVNRPLAGQKNCHNGVGNSNLTVRRTEISGCENALNIDRPGHVRFVDNYVHDLDTRGPSYVWGNTPHTDGIQVGEGASHLVIRHNSIDPSPGGGINSDIIMYTGSGTPNSSVWIENNYLDARGASYAIYAPRSRTHAFHINRNRMRRGVYGYTACVRPGSTVASFKNNRNFASGRLIRPDKGVGGGCSN